MSEAKKERDDFSGVNLDFLHDLKSCYLLSSKQLNPIDDPSLIMLGKYFELYRMDMSSEVFKFYLDILGNNTEKLVNVSFYSYPIDVNHAKFLGIGLSYCLQLESLNLSHCELDDEALVCIVKGIANIPGLIKLELVKNRFSTNGLNYLLRGFKYTHVLEYLDLSQNKFTAEDVGVVSQVLEMCEFLCVVRLESLISDESTIQMLKSLSFSYKSKTFFISLAESAQIVN
jgi:hypothetical protein